LVNFTDPPTQRSAGLLRNLRGERYAEGPGTVTAGASPESANDSRSVFPLTLHHNGRLGGPYILYAESAQARTEWKLKLEEALGLRKVVQESNKVFEVETLSADTFLVPSMMANTPSPAWTQDNTFTGKVTCSVPFSETTLFVCYSLLPLTSFQTLRTAASLLPSGVQKVCGLGSAMILNVCVFIFHIVQCDDLDDGLQRCGVYFTSRWLLNVPCSKSLVYSSC
jgi:hypothetical protein